MSETLVIFQKTYALLLWLYPIINRIPKSHRLVLGKNLEEIAIKLLILITKANKEKSKSQNRLLLQQQISNNLDYLRILIRLTKDLKFMSIKQYGAGATRLNEISRILNAWMKV